MSVLVLDFGTSSTKAGLWSQRQLVARAREPIPTTYPRPGWAEQNPDDWWLSAARACGRLRDQAPEEYAAVDALGCSTARETFVCTDSAFRPRGRAILWSDTRAAETVDTLGDPDEFRATTGVVLGPATAAAKIAWVRRHAPHELEEPGWILGPRDFVLARLTGEAATDPTVASRTGLYRLDGELLAPALAPHLPPVLSSTSQLAVRHGEAMALADGTPVIIGAGDRACEVIAVASEANAPMVSWGTTANVSVPEPGPLGNLPRHAQISHAALGGYLLEAGLSGAGSVLDWLSRLTQTPVPELLDAAADVQPGADGLLALPWLQGARAPWWHADVFGAFAGVAGSHGAPELARALLEGIALDVQRSVELVAPNAHTLQVVGAGAELELWRAVLASVTGLPTVRRQWPEATLVGARLLVAKARLEPMTVEDLNPVSGRTSSDEQSRTRYREVRAASDRFAGAVLDRAPGEGLEPPTT